MSVLSHQNRAPNFKRLYADINEFQIQRDEVQPIAGAIKAAVPFSMGRIKNERRLPSGFSVRSFSLEIAHSIQSKIVSEHDGLIDQLLIAVPRETKAPIDPMDARHYFALFKGLGSWVKYIVLCDPRQKKAIFDLAQSAGIPSSNITFAISPRFNYSIWAQDAYVALTDSTDGIILCEGISFPRYEDMTIADDVAAQSDVSVLQSHLYFQGGNVLNAGGITLIGMDYVERNTRRFGLQDTEAVKAQFSTLFGTDILPIGGRNSGEYSWYENGRLSGYGFQPIFHIDMYVTPTGVLGASGKEIVFLGRPEAAKQAVGKYSDVQALNNSQYNSFFDETEAALTTRFEVQYLPLWITQGDLGYTGQVDPRYYNLTFNNCIVQNSGDVRKVLLPSYSQDAALYGVDVNVRQRLEAAAENSWKSLGFEVTWMDGVEDLAFNQGAVHCITKTLRRKNNPE